MTARALYLQTGDPADCTGCAACAFACPKDAICMVDDAYGFEYPEVDLERCVHCDRCLRSCHMGRTSEVKHDWDPQAYGMYVKDESALWRSASGGVATTLCEGVLSCGGVAYGCVTRREDVRHERLASFDDLERARGSKYVQSDVSGIYAQVSADLKAGLPVSFVGTPCQCAAMRLLFGKYENLLLIDLICEGVPSRRMYADFLNDIEAERGAPVTDFRFRDKRDGWLTKNAVVVGECGEPFDHQPHSYCYYYYGLFAEALILRDSCYRCPYACSHRVGDITVGDLWGAETSGLGYSLAELRGGISSVLVNSERGVSALSWNDGKLDSRSCALSVVSESNGCLVRPSRCDEGHRRDLLEAYSEKGSVALRDGYGVFFAGKARAASALAAHLPLLLRVLAKKAKHALKGRR